MDFRTEIVLPRYDLRLMHSHHVLSMGSCFADMVGHKLSSSKFPVVSNPFGTVFNPISLFRLLTSPPVDPRHLVERDGIWYSLDVHSEISSTTKQGLLDQMDSIRERTLEFIAKADCLIVTLGTAFVHMYQPTGEIISNCQKLPQKNFTKRLISSNFILKSFREMDQIVRSIRPGISYIFTVSPVRHIKDTLELNQVSKSTLRVACHKIIKECPNAIYFPSYEIMMDDLRDYRFYKEDLIHPSEMAEAYIWKKFSQAFFPEDTQDINDRLEKIHRSLLHRPMQPTSPAYLRFLTDLKSDIEEVSQTIGMEEEMAALDQLFTLHSSNKI